MHGPEQSLAPDAAQVTEVSFDAAGGGGLKLEAAGLGVTGAQYVHDAALMRVGERRADQHRPIDALAREVRDEAIALRAESRQARLRAAEVRGGANAILDTVVMLITDVLRRQGFPLRAPVVARFREAENGNTGVEVAVRLEDPRQVSAAKAAIAERFPDHLSEVIVR